MEPLAELSNRLSPDDAGLLELANLLYDCWQEFIAQSEDFDSVAAFSDPRISADAILQNMGFDMSEREDDEQESV